MDMTPMVDAVQNTLVSIQHPNPGCYPVPGVLVQGSGSPLVVSGRHCFGGVSVGQQLTALLQAPEEAIDLQILADDNRHDVIVFKVLSVIFHRRTAEIDFDPACTSVGKPYAMFGCSSCTLVDNTGFWHMIWRMTPGTFSTGLSHSMTIAMSGGSVAGDSGGPVFSPVTRRLLGINISVSIIHPGVSTSEAARMRVSSEGNMVPFWFESQVLKDLFLPGGELAQHFTCSAQPTNINQQSSDVILEVPAPANVCYCGASENVVSAPELDWISSLDEALDPYN
ncbi:hypothetical protein GOP47_0017262 [Adiantum capillus-veneris]|nr:hypothetical protein GOP47_0017262 [Adiantum capillus-veneris]